MIEVERGGWRVEGGGWRVEGDTLDPALPKFLLQLLESLLVLDFHPESLSRGTGERYLNVWLFQRKWILIP